MKRSLIAAGRFVALWFAMMMGTVASGLALHLAPRAAAVDGPVSAPIAMLVVTGLGALVIGLVASRLAVGPVRRFALLTIVVFMLETGLSSIESAVFQRSLGLSTDDLRSIALAGLVRALATALAAALLWRAAAPGDMARIRREPLRLAAIVAIYVVLYLAAGMVAWRSEAVRAFYGNGLDISMPALIALQAGRGALWCAIAVSLAATLRGSRMAAAACTAAALAVLMAAPLLYPSAIMPWSVRRVHLVELAVSNALFGLAAIMLLRTRRRAAHRRNPESAVEHVIDAGAPAIAVRRPPPPLAAP